MNFWKKQRPHSVMGLTFDGSNLVGVVLRRSNGSLQQLKHFAAPLALSPFSADPELLGREIRNHLNAAGVRERACVVALPLNPALAAFVELPELPESDVAGFLEIEGERAFPYGQEALITRPERFQGSSGRFATLIAYQRAQLMNLEAALRAAQLRPLSLTLGIAALQRPDAPESEGAIALLVGENFVDLVVTAGGGMVSLRSLNGVFEGEGVQRVLSAELVARELRITLGQLPAPFRDAVRRLRVFGVDATRGGFLIDLETRVRPLGLSVQRVEKYSREQFAKITPEGALVSPAFAAAAHFLCGTATTLEFLPPRVSSWQRVTTRVSSRKLAWAGGAAAALFLLVGGAFAIQQWQLSTLNNRWSKLSPQVTELEGMQQMIRKYRPWYDQSLTSLTILRRVTEAFPVEGMVTAKSLEIRDHSSVTCSGTASDNQALLKVLDQLRAAKEVSNLKVDQVRGKTPMQFTFNFHWGEGGKSGY